MKVCIISFCNIYVLPYASTYIERTIENGNDCTLLFWDKDAVNGDNDQYPNCRKVCFQKKMTPKSSATDKFFGYCGATLLFNKELKMNDYDRIVFLQTHAAISCYPRLQKYRKKYIVDIRDYTLENHTIYSELERKVINEAYCTVISSPAYRTFLPTGEYVVAHNYSPFSEKVIRKIRENTHFSKTGTIGISFIGTIRFLEMDKKILSLFSNDSRFSINYFGTGSDILKTFCEENNITNVKFHGGFSPDNTADFYVETDVINNLYGNHNPFLDYALSNKLYHAAQLHMPILVCPNTYMEKITTEYCMGYVFDVNRAESPNEFYKWFVNIDRNMLARGADEFLDMVTEDNSKYINTIDSFLSPRAAVTKK